ncbi:hypothetical protein WH299_20620 [Pseudomonas sp. MYb541]|nr:MULTISPECIES: hypothetical protein [unclassified Pseudomonas]
MLGGINLYQYATNPLGWSDPLGWCSTKLGKNMGLAKVTVWPTIT